MTSDPLTPEALDTIEARANAATEGPWVVAFPINAYDPTVVGGGDETLATVHAYSWDAQFIAASREDVPRLVAEVRRKESEIVATRQRVIEFAEERDESQVELRRLRTENEEQGRAIKAALSIRDRHEVVPIEDTATRHAYIKGYKTAVHEFRAALTGEATG